MTEHFLIQPVTFESYDKKFGQHHFLMYWQGQEFYQYEYQIISGNRSRSLPGYYEPDAAALLVDLVEIVIKDHY